MKKITPLPHCLARCKTLLVRTLLTILFGSFGILANATTHQYAVSDVAALNTDLKAGTYDVYELTTPGGLYVFNTGSTSNNNTLVKSTTIRAATGLTAKPILSLYSTTSGSTANIFYTATPNITLTFDGLELNGINLGGAGQPLLFYAAAGAYSCKVYVTNCYIHDFLNASGNGVFRFDGYSSTTNTGSSIDIQGSTICSFGGKAIYFNPSAATNTTGNVVNLKNNIIRNNSLLSSKANLIYAVSANTGTTTIDHCTFYNIVTTSTSEGMLKFPSGSGAITISHSVFSSVGQTLPTSTISFCYLAGFTTPPTGTNTFAAATAPVFSDPTVQDFALTNKSSFICTDDGLPAGISLPALYQTKLTAPTVLDATNVVGLSMKANWTPNDPNATGYTVYVYQGASAPTSTSLPVVSKTVSGQSTSSLLVSGLTNGTTYTYKVVALGDGSTTSNSVSSGASSSFIMPKLSTPDVTSGAISPTSLGFTTQWTAVTNATSYDVLVYQGSTLISTTNAPGQSTVSLDISGLMSNTAYTYKVMAKGDGISWGNSDISVASAGISTVGLPYPVVAAATLQAVNGFTANWAVVPNAVSYQIRLYLGSALLSTTSVPGDGTVSSYAITGLQMGTSYSYKVIAIGDNLTPATLTSSPSASSAVTKTLYANVDVINTNFADGSWGNPALTGTLVSGLYGTISINGFDLAGASLYPSTVSGLKGDVVVNTISVDKLSNNGIVALPTVNSLQQLEIHGYAPTAGNGFKLTEWNGTAWVAVAEASATYTTAAATLASKLDSVYIFNIPRTAPARFRIENPNSGGFILTKVITRTNAPALLPRPVANAATAITATGFTASLATVPNAVSYDVYVYQAGVLVPGFPVNMTATSSAITGLASNTSYTYKAVAKGDADLTYSDSYVSLPVAAFTTLLTTPAVQPASGINATGFTANWLDVPGAVSYDVYLFDNASNPVGSVVNVTEPTLSYAFTGLTQDVAYTYKVIARGDGVTTFDSAISNGITATPSTATGVNDVTSTTFVTAIGKTILCSETGLIQVYNLQGARVLQVSNTGKVATTLESGLYIVRFTGNDGQITSTKVMIK